MEFRYRSSEERPAPTPPVPSALLLPPPQSLYSSNEFFVASADPAMREGLAGPKRSIEELQRELYEERIKEEIMVRRIAQRRMMEEQLKRELEMERGMMMSNRFHHQPPVIEPLMAIHPEDRFGGLVPLRREAMLRERFFVPGQKEVDSRERLPLRTSPSEPHSGHDETMTIDEKPEGIRMKTSTSKTGFVKLLEHALKKDWSCALCEVSMTCEDSLNDHLKGKKHLARTAKFGSEKKSVEPTTKSTSKPTTNNNSPSAAPKKSRAQMRNRLLGGKKVSIRANGKMQEVIQKGIYLWCPLCKVKCNSRQVMETHLLGKKHVLLESKNRDDKAEEGGKEEEDGNVVEGEAESTSDNLSL